MGATNLIFKAGSDLRSVTCRHIFCVTVEAIYISTKNNQLVPLFGDDIFFLQIPNPLFGNRMTDPHYSPGATGIPVTGSPSIITS